MDDDQLQELLWDDAGDEQQEQDDYDGDKHPLEDELDGRCGPKDCQEDSIPLMEEPPEQPQQRQIPDENSGRAPPANNTSSRGFTKNTVHAKVPSSSKPQPSQQTQDLKVRYFIIRSNTQENIDISVRMGAWATLKHNEEKLDHAFNTSDEVRLLFSVNGSFCFQGYAVMRTPVGQYQGRVIWSSGQPFGNPFSVEWKCLYSLPFDLIKDMRNPLNENMPVTKARDGQELPTKLGNRLVEMMEQAAREAGVPPPPKAAGRGRGSRFMSDLGGRGMMGRGGRGDMGRGRGMPPIAPMGGGMGPAMMGMGHMGPMNPMAGNPMMGSNTAMMAGLGRMGGMGGMHPAGMGMSGNAMGRNMGSMRMGMDGSDALDGDLRRSPPRGRQPGMGMGHMRERSRSPVHRPVGAISGMRQQQGRDSRMYGNLMQQQQQGRSHQKMQQQSGSMGLPDTVSNHPDLLSLSYDEYLDYYQRLQRKMEGMKEVQRGPSQQMTQMGGMAPAGASTAGTMDRSMGSGMGMGMREPTPPSANPAMLMMQQQQAAAAMAAMGMGMGIPAGMAAGGMMGAMNPMLMAAGMGGAGMMGGMNPMLAAAGGAGMMMGGPGMMGPSGMGMQNMQLTEAEYIQRTVQHFRSHGQEPPSEAFIRQHYRKERDALMMGGGMRM